MSLKLWVLVFLTWQLSAARSLSADHLDSQSSGELDKISYKEHDLYIHELTPKEAKILASWTEDSKQNIWELSGQFEGDMVLSMDQRNGLVNTIYRWPNLEIPYEIDPIFNTKQKEWIIHSLTDYYNKTCIKPRLRKQDDRDYVYITGQATGCHSFVGRQGGRQTLNLQPNEPGTGCLRLGTVVHEFLHALGFYHQQSATNRDDYVDVIWDNIEDGKQHNFNKYTSDVTTSFGERYDYGSVMHYSAYAFSKNGEKTIVTKNDGTEIGQRLGISEIDAAKLNKMYNCN